MGFALADLRAVFFNPKKDFLAGFFTRFSATNLVGLRPLIDIPNLPELTYFFTLYTYLYGKLSPIGQNLARFFID
ncbi:MAG: hypothetical protein AAFY09_02455 [Pseudomonadota bacterium]